MKPENRTQLMEYSGSVQKNTVWSWCAVNEDKKQVYLSVWTDSRMKRENDDRFSYLIMDPYWGTGKEFARSNGRPDLDEKLSKIFDQNYSAFGYFVVAKD